jgi:hypothetical protein
VNARCLRGLLLLTLSAVLAGCGSDAAAPGPTQPTRTWEMGFHFTPPRIDLATALRNSDLFRSRAELAVLHEVRLGGTGPDVGIEQDLADFPITQMLGLSSYLYFGHAQPENIPDDYHARLLNGRMLPAIVCEGGWASASVAPFTSSPELQARYLTRQAVLLDSVDVRAAVQTLFTDLDLDSLTDPYPVNLPLFGSLGLMQMVGDAFVPKPALAVWDGLYARRRL